MRPIFLGLFILMLAAGCSYQTALDKLASRERQAEIIALAQDICASPEKVTPKLHPEIAGTLAAATELLPDECPGNSDGVKWQLASYNWKTNNSNGTIERSEDAIVVATAPDKWSVVKLGFFQLNSEPQRIVAWNVFASKTKPAELQFVEDWEANAQTMKWVAPVIGIVLIGVIFWLIRRQRKRRAD